MNLSICGLFKDTVSRPTSHLITSNDKMICDYRQLIGKSVERSGRGIN